MLYLLNRPGFQSSLLYLRVGFRLRWEGNLLLHGLGRDPRQSDRDGGLHDGGGRAPSSRGKRAGRFYERERATIAPGLGMAGGERGSKKESYLQYENKNKNKA